MPPARLKWSYKPLQGWVQEPRVEHPSRGGPGWRKGRQGYMAKYKVKFLNADEKTAILTLTQKGRTIPQVAKAIGRNESTITRFLVRMADTSVLAKATLKAGAARLAERVVEKANVVEAVEVLSRPGMDVLQPAAIKGGGGGFGIQVSVGVGSCGTVVKIEGGPNAQSVAQGVEPRLLEAEYPERPSARLDYIEVPSEASSDGKG